MCGIALCYSSKNLDSNKTTKNIIDSIKHRGPDNQGFANFQNLSLGSCRLSIFDLSDKGNMPMKDNSGRYTIIYNGEIYNFKSLKKQFNLNTKTNTDTEVLLELYSIKKEKCLDYLNGIFAFVIYDSKENSLFCARDHLGVKPFYYSRNKDYFVISSEIKALYKIFKNDFNINNIKSYLSTSFYDLGEFTFYKGINQLKPGHYIKFFLQNNNFQIQRYWDLRKPINKDLQKKSQNELVEHAYSLIKNSFKIQCQADVKIGINVSSGIDSKLMLYFLDNINSGQGDVSANSYYFDEEQFNEKKDLEKISNKLNWKVNFHEIKSEDIINNFDEIFIGQEGPFPGITTMAKSILIKKAYGPDQKVILEAQGGDDIAGGYRYIFGSYINDLLKQKRFIKIIAEIAKFKNIENISYSNVFLLIKNSISALYTGGLSADGSKNINQDIFTNEFLNIKLTENEFSKEIISIQSDLNKIIYRDIFYTKLQRILKSCDRSSMAYSKELRVPILDKNVVEFFYNLDSSKIINNGNLRYLYRMLFQKKFKENGFEKKKYISDPQIKWLKSDLFDWAYSIMSDMQTFNDGIYNTKKLLTLFEKFRDNDKIQNSNLFWQAICLKKMLKNSRADKYI